jgi:hypothetical protein
VAELFLDQLERCKGLDAKVGQHPVPRQAPIADRALEVLQSL